MIPLELQISFKFGHPQVFNQLPIMKWQEKKPQGSCPKALVGIAAEGPGQGHGRGLTRSGL